MNKIKEMIKKEKTTQTAFAKRFGIPLRTVQNWCRNERECPKYLENLIEKEIERKENLLYLLSNKEEEIVSMKFCIETSEEEIAKYYDSLSQALKEYKKAKIYAKNDEITIYVYLTLYIQYKDETTDNIYLLSEAV